MVFQTTREEISDVATEEALQMQVRRTEINNEAKNFKESEELEDHAEFSHKTEAPLDAVLTCLDPTEMMADETIEAMAAILTESINCNVG